MYSVKCYHAFNKPSSIYMYEIFQMLFFCNADRNMLVSLSGSVGIDGHIWYKMVFP